MGFTDVFKLEFMDPSTPLRQLDRVTKGMAQTIEAALLNRGSVPTGYTDLIAALAARVSPLEVPPIGFRATASQPAGSVPGNALVGCGTPTISAQRGGFTIPGADQIKLPTAASAAGLYVLAWTYSGQAGVGWAAERNFLQVNVNTAANVNPDARSPVGSTGDNIGTAVFLVSCPAGASLRFQAFTTQNTPTTSSSVITGVRLAPTF